MQSLKTSRGAATAAGKALRTAGQAEPKAQAQQAQQLPQEEPKAQPVPPKKTKAKPQHQPPPDVQPAAQQNVKGA
jgi:hypothetical protein